MTRSTLSAASIVTRPTRCRRLRRPGPFALAVLALAMLLWARFLLVTGHPRTAIAAPVEASATALAR